MNAFGPPLPQIAELAPGIRRVLAPNPSMMTGPGTNTYLIGTDEITVVDPGPSIAEHLARIRELAERPIRRILVTHTHPDHSPGAAVLARATGAELLGRPSPGGRHQDSSFVPDVTLADGDTVPGDACTIEAIHTPGHASNHLCYRIVEKHWLLTGDHVIDGSTVVIDPPDGDMQAYLESLARLREMRFEALLPGHGGRIDEPNRVIEAIIAHRLKREEKVAAALAANPGSSATALVPHAYPEIGEHLYRWAERSLLAHLIKLEREGRARRSGPLWRPVPA